MAKSVLYATNSTAQSIGGNVNFGSAVRRFGCNCNIFSGQPYIVGSGYYSIETNLTLVPSATGTAVVTLYKDGEAIPGATATLSVTAADSYSVTVPAIVRQFTCGDASISAVVSGVAGSVASASIILEKL